VLVCRIRKRKRDIVTFIMTADTRFPGCPPNPPIVCAHYICFSSFVFLGYIFFILAVLLEVNESFGMVSVINFINLYCLSYSQVAENSNYYYCN